ncbi:MAG: AAA family ATPase [Verrucomicrobiota bacterium]
MHLKKVSLNPAQFSVRHHYPLNLRLFHENPAVEFPAPVTFFVGENGTGKSTLLRALCHKCGVYIWGGFEEPDRYERELLKAMTVEWANGPVPGSFFSSELFHNFSEIVEEWEEADPGTIDYFGGKSLVAQSHGQSLMSYFQARYKIPGIYFLDEPETALSPRSQLELLKVLTHMGRAGHAQFIIASHSPVLLACPGACLYSFDSMPIRPVDYETTDYYRFYRDFMNHRDRFLNDAQ